MQVRKQQLQLDMEQQTGSKLGKEYVKAVQSESRTLYLMYISLMSSTVKAVIPCLFNLHAEYIMRNAGLEEAQAGIKITGRSINNLRYADDTILMAESE